MNPHFEHQTLRVHQDVALTAFDLLGQKASSRLSEGVLCTILQMNFRLV
jgi:hypothetical protein